MLESGCLNHTLSITLTLIPPNHWSWSNNRQLVWATVSYCTFYTLALLSCQLTWVFERTQWLYDTFISVFVWMFLLYKKVNPLPNATIPLSYVLVCICDWTRRCPLPASRCPAPLDAGCSSKARFVGLLLPERSPHDSQWTSNWPVAVIRHLCRARYAAQPTSSPTLKHVDKGCN